MSGREKIGMALMLLAIPVALVFGWAALLPSGVGLAIYVSENL